MAGPSFCEDIRVLSLVILSLVALSPDTHLFGVFYQLISEIRMGYGDESFSSLPCSQPLQDDFAVFRHYIVSVGPGIGHDGAFRQCRLYSGFYIAGLVCKGRGAADKALSAFGQIRSQHKVQLLSLIHI